MIDPRSIKPGTVTVFIGKNGSGKSWMLRDLCASYLGRGDDVIAIAPSIHDRFSKIRRKGIKFFGARQGRSAVTKIVRSALAEAASGNLKLIKNLIRTLEYAGFDRMIGMRLSCINSEYLEAVVDRLADSEKMEFRSIFEKWKNRMRRQDILEMRLDSDSFSNIDSLSFSILAKHDDLIHKTKLASRIEYYLYRKGEPIPLLDACSGELCFISTMAFISTQIKPKSIVAIDEPETSLHPSWQKSYVETLLDLFHYYEPRILISTHSPIIISGAEETSANMFVYEMTNGAARPFNHAKLSLEEMYDRLFGLITPKNHYLSQRAVDLLNDLNSNKRNLNNVILELEALSEKSYDESQRMMIKKVQAMARELDSMGGDAVHG